MLLSLWLGSALFLSGAVAPAAFAVLPSRELAGALVGRVLPLIFWSGAIVGIAVLAIAIRGRGLHFRRTRLIAAAAMVIACLIAELGIAPRIASLRTGLSAPLVALPAEHPQRVLFGRLHMLSVAWLGVAILAATSATVVAFITVRPGGRHE